MVSDSGLSFHQPSGATPFMRPIVTVLEQAALVAGVNPDNLRCLGSKREHGQIIPPEALRGASALSATRPPASERPFCYDCFRPRDGCVCRTITPVDNRTPVLIVQHPRERFHPLGTVRLAKRALSRIRVAIWGDTFAQQASWLDEPLPAGAALLFPSPRARPLDEFQPAEYPQTLDGRDFKTSCQMEGHNAMTWRVDPGIRSQRFGSADRLSGPMPPLER